MVMSSSIEHPVRSQAGAQRHVGLRGLWPRGGGGNSVAVRGGWSCWQRVGTGGRPDRREHLRAKPGDSAQGCLLGV